MSHTLQAPPHIVAILQRVGKEDTEVLIDWLIESYHQHLTNEFNRHYAAKNVAPAPAKIEAAQQAAPAAPQFKMRHGDGHACLTMGTDTCKLCGHKRGT
jgi:hypothetical protein